MLFRFVTMFYLCQDEDFGELYFRRKNILGALYGEVPLLIRGLRDSDEFKKRLNFPINGDKVSIQ